ncbi:hypothetical protein [Enterobacter sp. Bisph1]|uniref:hypothetical protein n=1 Tax=Enterobacter sp. Bisph1 TaxID=1274399 RepID=UPI00057BE00F|nr:hypothetical protein [Enterobacter sp. Bisph1]
MKVMVYFVILSVVLTTVMSALFLALKVAVVLIFYFKTNVFAFDVSDIRDVVLPGCVIGVWLSLVTVLILYLQHRKNKRDFF